MSAFVTRFAPSPTGFLHLGHAYSALKCFRAAQNAGGRFILRIEDIDQTRCKPVFEEAIYEDLKWLGITWEEPVRRQSQHFGAYREALHRLIDRGLLYRCFKTRKEIIEEIARAPHLSPSGPEGPQYVGEALAPNKEQSLLADGVPFAWRLSLKEARAQLGDEFNNLIFSETGAAPNGESGILKASPEMFGDAIIGRKDNGASYHLACVVDDALQDVTHIIRGEDLFHSTHLHIMLQKLLGLPTPRYYHHELKKGSDGKRYAKRDKSVTLRSLRESGMSIDAIMKVIEI